MERPQKNRSKDYCPSCGYRLRCVTKRVYTDNKKKTRGTLTDYVCINEHCSVTLIIIERIAGNMKKRKICDYCNKPFTAYSGLARYCSQRCRFKSNATPKLAGTITT